MSITVTPLTPCFAARVDGADITRPLDDGTWAHVTRPEFCYRHEWQEADLVVWDNRCVLHRATPYDTVRHKRLMQRTTVSGDPAEAGKGSSS